MSTPYTLFVTPNASDSAAPGLKTVAVSSTTAYYSRMFGGNGMAAYDLSVFYTGTPTGTLILQVSNKPNPNEASDADWDTTSETTMTNPAGAAAHLRVSFAGAPGKHRLKYTNASGSGTIAAYVTVSKYHLGN